MDWAYRMIGSHSLDPLGVAIVLHLGWRDAAAQRTDRGIAAALSQHRSSVCKATAKLAALGLIVRRSGQWVAAETVAIVEERADAKRPAPDAADCDGGPLSGPDYSVDRGGPLSGPAEDHSVGHKRKEKIEKAPARVAGRPASPRPLKGPGGPGFDVGNLTAFQRERVRLGETVLLAGGPLSRGSAAMREAQAAMIAWEKARCV